MNKNFKLAFSSVCVSLGTVLMLITIILPIANYALAALAGLITCAVVIEINVKYAFSVYLAISLLSLLLLPDKEAVTLFIIFFGYYPIIKYFIEKIKNKIIQIIIKLITFNISAILFFFISINLLNIPEDSFYVFGLSIPIIILTIGNIVFLIYDYTVTGLISIYINYLHPKIKKSLKF